MAFFRRWLLMLLALALAGETSFAAKATKEQRAYAAAASAFSDAMWRRAEMEFAQFVQKYPNSTDTPQAVLLQAQAEFKQEKLTNAIALLAARKARAGILADQYDSWIGEAQFAGSNFLAAATTFSALAKSSADPSMQLPAVVKAASAYDKLGAWAQSDALLAATNGVFARALKLDSGNEWVASGQLLLAHSKNAQRDFNGAFAVLHSMNTQILRPSQSWQWNYLLCQNRAGAGDLMAALVATTNLLQAAQLDKDDSLRNAESVKLRAQLLEKLDRPGEAIAAYQLNLTNAPVIYQREAILKIAELSVAQNQFTNAEPALEDFLRRFPRSPLADMVLFTLGEMHLKDYVVGRPTEMVTNHLQQAAAAFDQFVGTFTNSPLLGRAYLDRGWCDWLADKKPESFNDFNAAVQRLPLSEDLVVAKFKLGDSQFARNDFVGALTNYRAVLNDFSEFPEVEKKLGARALYQSLRADLELKDMTGASNVLTRILKIYPTADFVDSSTLLVGEGITDSQQPSAARDLYEKFEKQSANSPLLPQVELAVARTYEREGDWPAAIARYDKWLKDFPANPLRPQAAYALALANFQAGSETNAFPLFTNFVAQFPTNELAPLAQWWVADHFFRAGDFVDAERNYKSVFQNTNWQGSSLVYPAQMMAGLAAAGWGGYADAIGFFTGLAADTNCPPDLSLQAQFAWGSALMRSDSTDTNNPLANFQSATNVFGQICRLYPTNDLGVLAWIEIGKCDSQLMNYDAATNAYAQVFNSSSANISARSQAQVGFGIALEKKAALADAAGQTNLLQLALDNYLQVFDTWTGNNLRAGETADSFWVKKAGLQAADLVGTLGEWTQAVKIYSRLEVLLPQLKDSLDKKIAAAQEHLPPEQK